MSCRAKQVFLLIATCVGKQSEAASSDICDAASCLEDDTGFFQSFAVGSSRGATVSEDNAAMLGEWPGLGVNRVKDALSKLVPGRENERRLEAEREEFKKQAKVTYAANKRKEMQERHDRWVKVREEVARTAVDPPPPEPAAPNTVFNPNIGITELFKTGLTTGMEVPKVPAKSLDTPTGKAGAEETQQVPAVLVRTSGKTAASEGADAGAEGKAEHIGAVEAKPHTMYSVPARVEDDDELRVALSRIAEEEARQAGSSTQSRWHSNMESPIDEDDENDEDDEERVALPRISERVARWHSNMERRDDQDDDEDVEDDEESAHISEVALARISKREDEERRNDEDAEDDEEDNEDDEDEEDDENEHLFQLAFASDMKEREARASLGPRMDIVRD